MEHSSCSGEPYTTKGIPRLLISALEPGEAPNSPYHWLYLHKKCLYLNFQILKLHVKYVSCEIFHYTIYFTAGAPTTTNLNDTVTVQEGDSVNVTCVSSGNPTPTILWYLGGSLAPFPKTDAVQHLSAEVAVMYPNGFSRFTDGSITSVLQIINATYPAHDGEYMCVGLNSHRERNNTSTATITVQVQGTTLVAHSNLTL